MTVGIGLAGAGAMGAEHAYCYGQMAGVRVARVFSRDIAKARVVAEPLSAGPVSDFSALIEDPSIEAIDVCLPSPAHAEAVVPALEAGKHVFCETPLALDLGAARRMRDAARRAGRLLQVGLLMRSIAPCALVRQMAESAAHGRLVHLSAHRLGSYLRTGSADHKAHYADPPIELMTFDLDFISWVMGPPARIAATASRFGEVVGETTALLDFGDGRSASVLASGMMPESFPFSTGFRAVFDEAAVESQTTISGGDVTSRTRLFRHDAGVDPPLGDANPYQVELERFVACVAGTADPALLDADRAIEALELSLAVREAAHTGRPVAIGAP
jgi:UDP-N-acetylglucosamine 3-dehydrogenase